MAKVLSSRPRAGDFIASVSESTRSRETVELKPSSTLYQAGQVLGQISDEGSSAVGTFEIYNPEEDPPYTMLGILIAEFKASDGELNLASVLVRDFEFNAPDAIFDEGVDEEMKTVAFDVLRTQGAIVRGGT